MKSNRSNSRLEGGVDGLMLEAIEKAGSLDKYLAKIEAKYPPSMLDYPVYHILKQKQEQARLAKRTDKPHEHLKMWRKRAKFTQQEVADMLGVTKQMVSAVEKGVKPMPREWLEIFDRG